jgi:hypothetical protein
MDRAMYLKICQAYNITGQHTVKHDEFEYYPKALELTYDKDGNPIYSAKLISKTSRHSVCYAKLENIEHI